MAMTKSDKDRIDKRITISLDQKSLDSLYKLAIELDLSLSAVVRRLILKEVEKKS
jgi:DNA-binding Lrp family transcriptional regulator